MADYANITLTRDGAVARLTLNRPDRRNALTQKLPHLLHTRPWDMPGSNRLPPRREFVDN